MRVVIVGGGILGLMHARSALNRGYEVVHLEREAGPRGASVRNFGLIWVSGRAGGEELQLALRARELWQSIEGTGFRANGSLTILRTPEEVVVAERMCARGDASDRGLAMLTPQEAVHVNPAVRGKFLAAVHCSQDATVESRLVPAALRAGFEATGRYTWLPSREAREIDGPSVVDHTGQRHDGDLVVQCTGAWHTGINPPANVRRVRIGMMQTAPLPEPVTTALADGDSMRYYPGWHCAELENLAPQPAVAAEGKMQLLLVQRLDGSLTIGDTHEYDEPFSFDVEERFYDHVRAVASEILGYELPPTARRWAGVYSQTTDGTMYRRWSPEPGVVVVTGPGGRGMTMSPAIAEETFA